MATIKQVLSRQIFDSLGNPTIQTTVVLDNGIIGIAKVPSDEVKNLSEAVELRDGDMAKYKGMGLSKAIDMVNSVIAPAVTGLDPLNQTMLDNALITLDATPDKSKLGANSMLSVSQAVAVAAAASLNLSPASYIAQITNNQSMKIPTPMFNLIEGGRRTENTLNFQEFLIIPASSRTYPEGLDIGVSVYHALRDQMKERGMNTLSAEGGGFSPEVGINKSALTFLKEAIEASGVTFSLDVFMGLDVAANTFYMDKKYKLIDRAAEYSSTDLVSYYEELFKEFALIYFEDAFSSQDIDGWKKMSEILGDKALIVGDDLITTNPYKLNHAIESNLIGGVMVKPDQIGTLSEAIAVAAIAKFKNLKVIVSGRCGETADTFIADFAVGIGADYVKFGAPARERMIKYNRLLELEAEMKST